MYGRGHDYKLLQNVKDAGACKANFMRIYKIWIGQHHLGYHHSIKEIYRLRHIFISINVSHRGANDKVRRSKKKIREWDKIPSNHLKFGHWFSVVLFTISFLILYVFYIFRKKRCFTSVCWAFRTFLLLSFHFISPAVFTLKENIKTYLNNVFIKWSDKFDKEILPEWSCWSWWPWKDRQCWTRANPL